MLLGELSDILQSHFLVGSVDSVADSNVQEGQTQQRNQRSQTSQPDQDQQRHQQRHRQMKQKRTHVGNEVNKYEQSEQGKLDLAIGVSNGTPAATRDTNNKNGNQMQPRKRPVKGSVRSAGLHTEIHADTPRSSSPTRNNSSQKSRGRGIHSVEFDPKTDPFTPSDQRRGLGSLRGESTPQELERERRHNKEKERAERREQRQQQEQERLDQVGMLNLEGGSMGRRLGGVNNGGEATSREVKVQASRASRASRVVKPQQPRRRLPESPSSPTNLANLAINPSNPVNPSGMRGSDPSLHARVVHVRAALSSIAADPSLGAGLAGDMGSIDVVGQGRSDNLNNGRERLSNRESRRPTERKVTSREGQENERVRREESKRASQRPTSQRDFESLAVDGYREGRGAAEGSNRSDSNRGKVRRGLPTRPVRGATFHNGTRPDSGPSLVAIENRGIAPQEQSRMRRSSASFISREQQRNGNNSDRPHSVHATTNPVHHRPGSSSDHAGSTSGNRPGSRQDRQRVTRETESQSESRDNRGPRLFHSIGPQAAR